MGDQTAKNPVMMCIMDDNGVPQFLGTTFPLPTKPTTALGHGKERIVCAAGTNVQVLKSGPALYFGYTVKNNSILTRAFKLYDKNANPVAGDVADLAIELAPGQFMDSPSSGGVIFTNGLALAIVTAVADGQFSGVSANDIILTLYFS